MIKSLCVLVVIAVVAEGGLAPFVIPCHSSDATCHLTSVQKAIPMLAAGIPALGMSPLDPLHIPKVSDDQAGLKIEFRDTAVKGLRNCRVINFKRSGHRHTIELQCSVTLVGDYTLGGRLLILNVEGNGRYKIKIPTVLTLLGDYTLGGRLLSLNIEGNGRYKIKIRDIIVKVQYETTERSVDGEQHWTITSSKHSFDVKGGADFQFQNLFNGNKQLSDTVHQFANNNWRDIFQEVAPPIVRAIVLRIVDEVKIFFEKVPLSQLALD